MQRSQPGWNNFLSRLFHGRHWLEVFDKRIQTAPGPTATTHPDALPSRSISGSRCREFISILESTCNMWEQVRLHQPLRERVLPRFIWLL